jgi:prepilin-type N-terminal cleavage/methylation domain-containing protein
MIKKRMQQQSGFTIVELMIASTVFSTILLLFSVGLLSIGRMYYKGITMAKAQETARVIMDDISEAIQANGGTVTPTPATTPAAGTVNKFCIGNTVYVYRLGRQLVSSSPAADQATEVIKSEKLAACNGALTINFGMMGPDSYELMAPNMRLSNLSVQPVPNTNLYTVTVRVVAGDSDLLLDSDGTNAECDIAIRNGSQFCAASELTTTIEKRIQ